MDAPDFSGLTRQTIQVGLDGVLLTPERDAVVFTAVKKGIDQAYQSGMQVNKHSRKPYLYAIGVLLALSVLIFASVCASQKFPALSLPANKSLFVDGAPSWEQVILADTSDQAQVDPVVVDARNRMGTTWGFVGSVQYKDYLCLRTVNYADNTVLILVYHWTPLGGWQYYDQQSN